MMASAAAAKPSVPPISVPSGDAILSNMAVTLDQATKFAQSLAKGQPQRGKIALTVLSDKVRELI